MITRCLGDLTFACHDEAMLLATYREIFEEQVYCFATDHPAPRIVDAGANLGVATCYFKTLYPNARITAIEPDPRMQELLRRNIGLNNLRGVTVEACGLAGSRGIARLHGDLASAAPHALGNSLVAEWGIQDTASSAVEVSTKPLSEFLAEPVDMLKLDIEGMEVDVLREAEKKLPQVREIRMEVHQTAGRPSALEDVLAILQRAGFKADAQPRPLLEILPAAAHPWFHRVKPEIFVVAATRKV